LKNIPPEGRSTVSEITARIEVRVVAILAPLRGLFGFSRLPMAYAMGSTLSPLRGWKAS
jgi:hypothetical protein